jgi:hypothetical protein
MSVLYSGLKNFSFRIENVSRELVTVSNILQRHNHNPLYINNYIMKSIAVDNILMITKVMSKISQMT